MASAAPEIPVLARDQSFENLYRQYVKDVYHYALALLRNPSDAEDVTQTTFMNAYRAFKRGDEIRKPQNWLIKIAHNVARTRYARASRRVKEVPLEDHVEQLAVPETERPDVEGVLRALGRLPFNQRAALVMRELEGHSYAEIADTLGVSVSAVETLIFRARRSLRTKASALRSLGSVPLPASLVKFFEGGAVVLGGGAVAGGGVIAKVVIALVIGGVATGIGGGNTRPAVAAAEGKIQWALASPSPTVHGAQNTRSRIATIVGRTRPERAIVLRGGAPAGKSVLGRAVRSDAVQTVQVLSRGATPGPASSVSLPKAPLPQAPAPTSVPDAVSTVAQVVEQAVGSVPPAPSVSLPPVEPPSLPPLPVPVPEPPPLPKLP